MTTSRRQFLQRGAAAGAAALWLPPLQAPAAPKFRISLAEWSLHRALFSGQLQHLDFPLATRRDYGLAGCELVNTFFKDKVKDQEYCKELKRRAADQEVALLLIMIDGEGELGDADPARRKQAIENHQRWVECAQFLGCHSIRVNAGGSGALQEHQKRAAESLVALAEFAKQPELNIIVENHGGPSSDGKWLAGVMKTANHPRVGTLPDFGNFYEYDRYQGVADLMPFAKAVSAKSYDFDEQGNETTIDYSRMLKIVLDAGYQGWIGIEYEGGNLPEPAGILATKALLERIRDGAAAAAPR